VYTTEADGGLRPFEPPKRRAPCAEVAVWDQRWPDSSSGNDPASSRTVETRPTFLPSFTTSLDYRMTDYRVQRIESATGFRRSHVQRLVAAIDALDAGDEAEALSRAAKISRAKARIVLRLARSQPPSESWFRDLIGWIFGR